MSSHAVRSVCSRTRPEIYQAGTVLIGYFRQFSTTRTHNDADGESKPKSTARERTRAAATEINSLVKPRNTTQVKREENHASNPKIIDVRSLPRGGMLRGRGGLSGRGGTVTAGDRTQSSRATSPSGNRFSGANRKRSPAIGARGGGGLRGRGGPARAGKPKKRPEEGDKSAAGPRGPRQDPFERMDPEEQEFDDAMRFGTKTSYDLSLTKESLGAFVPAVPLATEEAIAATALRNLSLIGQGDLVSVPQGLQARSYAEDLERNGMRFFADSAARDRAEEYLQEKRRAEVAAKQTEGGEGEGGGDATAAASAASAASEEQIIKGAEEAIRNAIVDKAIMGKHELPTFATDVVGIARAWHLRAETYTQRDVDTFEKKLASLVGGAAAARGPKGGQQQQQQKQKQKQQ